MKKIYKTIIIGAGISGIGCSNRLIEQNYIYGTYAANKILGKTKD